MKTEYELYIKGEPKPSIWANNIEEADKLMHQKYPYLTDEDYELDKR